MRYTVIFIIIINQFLLENNNILEFDAKISRTKLFGTLFVHLAQSTFQIS